MVQLPMFRKIRRGLGTRNQGLEGGRGLVRLCKRSQQRKSAWKRPKAREDLLLPSNWGERWVDEFGETLFKKCKERKNATHHVGVKGGNVVVGGLKESIDSPVPDIEEGKRTPRKDVARSPWLIAGGRRGGEFYPIRHFQGEKGGSLKNCLRDVGNTKKVTPQM